MAFRSRLQNKSGGSSIEQLEIEMCSPSSSPPVPVSPVCTTILPRKLRFASPSRDEDDEGTSGSDDSPFKAKSENSNDSAKTPTTMSISPPYRKVRALRLFDTPATPKTILEHCGPAKEKSSAKALNHLSLAAASDITKRQESLFLKATERPRSLPLHNRALDNVMQQQTANVNPFTPDSLMAHNKKRCRTQIGRENLSNRSLQMFLNSDEDLNNDNEQSTEMHQAPKRLALQDTNISRYKKEFVELSVIGIGEFGMVYQCLNRLDGCIYAIKKSIKPVAGSSFEKQALNEVWAHAVLGKHDNVVRYYSAWAEDNHMLIQNEYCNGGSLQSLLQKRCLVESELRILLLHVAEGLRYIHSNDLVHMDLKSGNIFLTKVPSVHKTVMPPLTKECYETGMDGIYEELSNSEWLITYKIGDLGHVTSVKEPCVEEGDCRYLPKEILEDDFSNLFKADIFALGLTLYEAAGGGPLPKNGQEWHNLRDNKVPDIPTLSREFNDLIKIMTHSDPKKRPSSTSIFNHSVLNSLESKSKAQLSQELTIEKRKNEILLRKLREARKTIKSYEQNAKAHHSHFNSPQKFSDQRCLRSLTRKKHNTPSLNGKLESLRDRNKNVINNFKY
ncbi:wee1-like protein kinase [Musca domestica]|uniref:Wee1-like protein kinase n=1 Tax=Musca domestica TaxID=7370 RepID=A0A1I8MRR1_MUSDO|nr:wee1-like protein kinase [Musca domestica]